MSPAATRRYTVWFTDWTVYETTVLASDRYEAIAKGKALYDLNGLGEYSPGDSGQDRWRTQCIDEEVQR
jgi:hypothetical protein